MSKFAPLLGMLFMSVGCSQERTRADFCDIVSSPPLFQRAVRVEATALFSDHGAYLAHPDCPTITAAWDETDEFESPLLRDAIDDLDRDPEAFDVDLGVDVDAHYAWRDNRRTFIVERLYSVRRAPRVYASELHRQAAHCDLASYTVTPDPQDPACLAYEQLLREERRGTN